MRAGYLPALVELMILETAKMASSYISNLRLFNFRNYKSMNFDFRDGVNIIFGKNGIGKTNILEALSFLSQGKGLRNSDLADIALKPDFKHSVNKQKLDYDFSNILWSLFFELGDHQFSDVSVFAGFSEEKKIHKDIKVDNKIQKQTCLNEIFNVIWLTPNMDSFFVDSSSVRRKFIDKAVTIIDSEHGKRVSKYEFLTRERMKILSESDSFDEKWVGILERKIAEVGISIAVARNEIIDYFNKVFKENYSHFPSLEINMQGYFENLARESSSLQCEEEYVKTLHNNRTEDVRLKKTQAGVHRSDLEVLYREKGMLANFCSTGEQKLMLISLTLAKVVICNMLHKARAVLLLDEVCSHLDDQKKGQLFDEISKLNTQSFLTGIHKELFPAKANFLDLGALCS